MMIATAERADLRLQDVLRLTGWNYAYVRKLTENGLLRVVHHSGHRNWYFRSDVAAAMQPCPKP